MHGIYFCLETGARLIESGKYKNAIIIGADTMSSIIDYKDRNTCVIFGDGGGGVLIEQTDDDYGIIDSILKTDGSGNQFLTVPAGGAESPLQKLQLNKDCIMFIRMAKRFLNMQLIDERSK